MLKELLILDIETVPQYESYEAMPPTWQKLWDEKVSKQIISDESPAELYRKRGGIMAEFGKIVCISTAIFSEQDDEMHLRAIISDAVEHARYVSTVHDAGLTHNAPGKLTCAAIGPIVGVSPPLLAAAKVY